MAVKTDTVTIRIGPKLKADLAAAAAANEMTLGEYIRHVLKAHLEGSTP